MAIKNIKTHSKKKLAKKYFDNNQLNDSLDLYFKILQLDGRDADAYLMSGIILNMQGRLEDSLKQFIKSVELKPTDLLCLYNLAIGYKDIGILDKSASVFEKILLLKPDFKDAINLLANVYIELKRIDDSITLFKKLVQLDPKSAEMKCDLGTVYQMQGSLDKAVECYQEALELKPGLIAAWDSLGNTLVARGDYETSLEAYRQSIARNPSNARSHSNLLLTLNYIERLSPAEVYAEHMQWGIKHCNQPLMLNEINDPDSARPLRIGYISADFRMHSVAYFIEPLLEKHNTEQYETWCYSSVPIEDETTKHLKALAFHWRDISKRSANEIAEQIKRDKIDILVDLSGHTSGNHMAVFIRKPAAIQITWLGYPNTTGISTIDYRLIDEITDPPGSEQYCSEELLRIPGSFLCFKPPSEAPDVDALPYHNNSYITFGSFNNLAKIGSNVIRLWADILKSVPNSRLIVKNHSLTDPQTNARFMAHFLDNGISQERVDLLGATKSRDEHLNKYNRIDIALDTFPYNGTTTSCEALWMGVPVICQLGDRHASRVTASILSNVNLQELIADDYQDYVFIACELAADIKRLEHLRLTMRARMRESVLCDSDSFARKVESIYRDIWTRYCE